MKEEAKESEGTSYKIPDFVVYMCESCAISPDFSSDFTAEDFEQGGDYAKAQQACSQALGSFLP